MKHPKIIALLVFVSTIVLAEEVPIAWLPHPRDQAVTNYHVWRSITNNVFVRFKNVGTNTSVVITNTEPGTVQFYITAQSRDGESIPSDTVLTVAQPPSRPILTNIPTNAPPR